MGVLKRLRSREIRFYGSLREAAKKILTNDKAMERGVVKGLVIKEKKLFFLETFEKSKALMARPLVEELFLRLP